MPGALLAPIALRATSRTHASKSPQVEPRHRHSLRNGVNGLSRARPGETGFCVTVACRSSKRKLGTCHWGARPARLCRPLTHCTSDNALASIASRLTFVTTRTPLVTRRDVRDEA